MGETVTDQEKLELHKQLCDDIAKVLSGHPEEVQSSVLAEMLATWLSGWPEALRMSLLDNHLKNAIALIEHVEVNKPKH